MGSAGMDHHCLPTPVCVRRTPPARRCVWSSVPCWSTGDAAYPHLQVCAWKRNRPAITWMNRAVGQRMCGSGALPVVCGSEQGSLGRLGCNLTPEREA